MHGNFGRWQARPLARPLRAALALLALSCATPALAAEQLTYTLTPDFSAHRLKVELTWQTAGRRAQSELRLSPHWGTLEKPETVVRDLRFDGVRKMLNEGARWALAHRPGATLSAQYWVDCDRNSFDWEHTHHPITTDTFFHGMGNAFLLAPQPGDGVPTAFEAVIRWRLPAGYQAACSLGVGRTVGATIAADDLRHAVYLAGPLQTKTVERGGISVTVAMVDAFAFKVDALAEMAAEIVRCEANFVGETRFPPFVLTAIPVGDPVKPGDARLAGVGLYHSFALMLAPQSELTDAVENLLAHELFHTWNGRLLGAAEPAGQVLWFTEGLTDYYALRILHDCGYWSAGQYSKWVNKILLAYAQNPAQRASNSEIAAGFWSQRNTIGEVAYQRGHLLGIRWHALARQHGVKDGFDALMLALLDRARSQQVEVSNALLRREGVRRLGEWFGGEFDRYVMQAEPIPLEPDMLGEHFLGRQREIAQFDLGFAPQSLKVAKVMGLRADSAAARAGLREGDELVGWNIHPEAERESVVQVRRSGRVQQIRFKPRGPSVRVMQFRPNAPQQQPAGG